MSKGQKCPMPRGNVDAIRTQIVAMRALKMDIFQIAEKMQDLWPGCTSNHVRGLLAGMCNGRLGGVRTSSRGSIKTAPRPEPWKLGEPQ